MPEKTTVKARAKDPAERQLAEMAKELTGKQPGKDTLLVKDLPPEEDSHLLLNKLDRHPLMRIERKKAA